VVILDAREPREFAGGTPYGESRAGHLPRAQSLHYRELIAADGRVLQGTELAEKLSALGVAPGARVVTYCSGGVRAAFVTMVLQDAGIDASNYAGSMWEWSAAPAEEFPLVSE
jgi:thiosulfate/3-mercaptopyruvate sulfurtransferase